MKKITSLVLLAMSGAFLLASCGEQPAASSQPTGSPTDSASTPAAQQITVKFNTDGGSAIADVKVDKGGKVAKPTDPTKEGYTFGKWYEDSIKVTEFDFDTLLSSDITLYASWVAATPSGSDSGSDSTPTPSSDSGSEPAGAVQYTVTALPWWMPNDGSTLFAWAWGGQSGDGAWYPISIEGNPTSGTEGTPCVGTFSVPAEVTGFNMARCKAGTTSPDWTVKGDAEGRIYNKSADVTCTAGTHSYESPAWTQYEYNPQ